MDEQVEAALADAFPDRTVDEVAPPGPSWNEKNTTARVEFADESTEELAEWVETEMDRRLAAIER